MSTIPAFERAYHVLDIANVIRNPFFQMDDVVRLHKVWDNCTQKGDTDQYFIATGPGTAAALCFGWPIAQKQIRAGQDGADYAIIEQLQDIDFIASRFDHVYLGTGDHIICEAAKKLVEAGVRVTIVAPRMSIHSDFYRVKGLEFTYLDDQWELVA